MNPPSLNSHVPVDGESALSVGQQALWSIYQMAPDSGAYNLASALRIRRPLDLPALQRAVRALTERHAVLRATFIARQGEPVQRLNPPQDFFLQPEDATTWSESVVRRRLSAEAGRPFDLERGPLLRVRLLTRATDEYILLLVMHHIVTDYRSLVTLIRDLGVFYEAERLRQPAALPPLELKYADYVRWHTDLMAGSRGDQLLDYWREQLSGKPPILNLPTDWPRPPIQTYRGSAHSGVLEAGLTRRLKEFSHVHGVTLETLLLAAFQVLLQRYTGQSEVWLGSLLPGRSRAEFSNLVGYFANSVVLRARFAGDPTFTEFLAQAHRTLQGALNHQEYAFATLVEHLHPDRDFSHSPLFQASFIFQPPQPIDEDDGVALVLNVAGAEVNVGGLRLESMALDEQTSQFDLTLMAGEVKGELITLLRYSTDLFEGATIARLWEHWQALLQSILANPDQPVSRLSLLTEDRRQQMLVTWNETGREGARGRGIHEWFEAQAARTPQATAVVGRLDLPGGKPGSLTYQGLNSRANQLARYLRTLKVGPGQPVGICLDRGVDVLTGILGIWKAGGAYVPLDPKYPPERCKFILQDTQAAVVVTQASLRDGLAAHGARVICLDADWSLMAAQSPENPLCDVSAEDLAYIIYTSGSTGEPKGVMITHANLWPHVQALQTVMGLTAQDRQLLTQSFIFSASVRQFLVPLCTGASVVIATSEQVQDPLALFELMKDYDVTTWGVTPSYWRNCANVLSGAAPEKQRYLLDNRLRLIVSSGELMGADVPEAWAHDLGHGARLVNMLGLTEVSGVVATYSIPATPDETLPNVPIGRPISNARIYVLDRHLEPVPIGLPGEIYVGGRYPARGYLHRPELTAERFIPDPFSVEPGARLCRTGDRARYRPDGNLEFLGRLDHQIKIRGYRIEPGEVEAVLVGHPGIREAVVTASSLEQNKANPGEAASSDKQLVAYLVADPAAPPTPGELRGFVKERLPDYMVPSAFVFLAAWPLTPTGKVDRAALPRVDASRPELDKGYAAPRNPVEEVLVRMWVDLLNVKRVGIHDNFFELGGHSLLAVQAMARLQEVFGVAEPLIAFFFEKPTVAGVADALIQSEAGQGDLEKITATLNLIADMSDEEVDEMLAKLEDDAM